MSAYWYRDPTQQAEYRRDIKAIAEWQVDAIRRFRAGLKKSRIIELPEANYYVYIYSQATVVREMRKFLLRKF